MTALSHAGAIPAAWDLSPALTTLSAAWLSRVLLGAVLQDRTAFSPPAFVLTSPLNVIRASSATSLLCEPSEPRRSSWTREVPTNTPQAV